MALQISMVPIKEYNRNVVIQRVSSLLSTTLESFESFWANVGIDEEETVRRTNGLLTVVFEAVHDLFTGEKIFYDRLIEKIASHKVKIAELSSQLGVEFHEVDDNLQLLTLEDLLHEKLVELSKLKHARIEKYKMLAKKENTLCNRLAIPKVAIDDFSTVPTNEQLHELEESLRMLEMEKKVRFEKFRQARNKLTTIMEVTEFMPETSFELEVMCYEDNTVQLSAENMHYLTEMLEKFEEKKKDLEQDFNFQKDKLIALWNRLAIPKEEQRDFLEKHSDVRQSSLSAIKNEIVRYEEIKKQNIGIYITKLKEELAELWKKCYISDEEQKAFLWLDCEDYSEELLEKFDEEVEKVRRFYAETKDIFDKIEKRKELWDMMLMFEKRVNDPNRFNNRGGNLLKEERERKKILKDLPRLEEEILGAIGKYEEDNNKMFLISGINFVEYIKEQWNEHNNEKENMKLQRQQLRMKEIEQAKTPSKRQTCTTPMSAPSKIFRSTLSATRTCRQVSRLAIGSTTPMSAFKPKKRSTSKWVSPRYTPNRRTPPRVLLERNDLCTTKLVNVTTYSQFETEVAREDRKICRSSGAHQRSKRCASRPKKVIGSKILHDGKLKKSFRLSSGKSSSYSLRSSTRNLSQSNLSIAPKTPTKLAPARGKLGLPFLI